MNNIEAFKEAKSIIDKSDLVIFLDYLSNKTRNPDLYEDIFDYFLNHISPDVKSVCIEALMTNIGRDDVKYQKLAIHYIKNAIDSFDEFDLRLQCISSLSDVFFNKKDLIILKLFYYYYINESENKTIRAGCFKAMQKVMYGMNSHDILKRNGKLILEIDDINLTMFKNEINQIRELLL